MGTASAGPPLTLGVIRKPLAGPALPRTPAKQTQCKESAVPGVRSAGVTGKDPAVTTLRLFLSRITPTALPAPTAAQDSGPGAHPMPGPHAPAQSPGAR